MNPPKKRNLGNSKADSNESCSHVQDVIQIDFDGFCPSIGDYHGIKILLTQLFRKAHVNLNELTDLIISQTQVGSVIKQTVENDDDDDDDDDFDNDNAYNQIFCVSTVINISRENVPCIQQLRNLLIELSKQYATDATNALITEVLENNSHQLGLIINERFINIPAAVSVSGIESLMSDMKDVKNTNKLFNFSHYLLICKLHKPKSHSPQSNENEESLTLWSNVEEEIFAEEAIADFEFCINNESDSALFGKWNETDHELIPYRRVLLLKASKLEVVYNKIKHIFN